MLPLGWDGDAQAQWEAGHKAEAIGRALTILDKTQHPVPELALQAAYYLYLVGDVPFARNILGCEIGRKLRNVVGRSGDRRMKGTRRCNVLRPLPGRLALLRRCRRDG